MRVVRNGLNCFLAQISINTHLLLRGVRVRLSLEQKTEKNLIAIDSAIQ